MYSLKQKISRPYIFLIIAIPFMIILFFNITIFYFSNIQAKNDLNAIFKRLTISLEFSKNKNINPILALLRAERLSESTKLIMYNAKGDIIDFDFIKNLSDKKIIQQILNAINPKMHEKMFDEKFVRLTYDVAKEKKQGKIDSFFYSNTIYYILKIEIESEGKPITAIYISKGNLSDDFVLFINKILVASSFFAIFLFIFISRKITNLLIKPIGYIINTVANAKSDSPIALKDNSNILELHILSQEINAMSEKIYDYNQSQMIFFQNASHELRTPLMSIQGYAEGIEQGIFPNTVQTAQIIVAETKRLSHLVEKLLTLSRIENIVATEHFKVVTLSEILDEYLQSINAYAIKNEKEVILQILSDCNVLISEELMYQAFINIISNCIRYAEKYVIIKLYKENEKAIIEISDDGKGISQEDLPHIFNKFYKGESGHFGLGLSITKSAVENMKGTISVKNGAQGAVFTLSFLQTEFER